MACVHTPQVRGELPVNPYRPDGQTRSISVRNRIIRVRANDVELATMKNLAAARGISLSDMVRRAALGVRMPAAALDRRDLAELACVLGALGRIGGNLNQLVRRANAGRLPGHDAELSRTLDGIDALRRRLRNIVR